MNCVMSAGSDLVVERRPAPTYSVGPPREKREVRKTTLTGKLLGDRQIPQHGHPRSLYVVLSLRFPAAALAVFIPWRGGRRIHQALGMAPAADDVAPSVAQP